MLPNIIPFEARFHFRVHSATDRNVLSKNAESISLSQLYLTKFRLYQVIDRLFNEIYLSGLYFSYDYVTVNLCQRTLPRPREIRRGMCLAEIRWWKVAIETTDADFPWAPYTLRRYTSRRQELWSLRTVLENLLG